MLHGCGRFWRCNHSRATFLRHLVGD
eukprot:SAG11_NODE_13967_length_631_cov_0.875940_1_plen_25_part_01